MNPMDRIGKSRSDRGVVDAKSRAPVRMACSSAVELDVRSDVGRPERDDPVEDRPAMDKVLTRAHD
jgi:hypothetical protein